MLFKIVLKNLILVALIAFAVNWIISMNIKRFSHKPVPHHIQYEEFTEEDIIHENQLLNGNQEDPA